MNSDVPILELDNISKYFPGVKALNGVSFYLKKGEVVGLVGENGAGKSTLVKIITGVLPKDQGTIKVNGKQVEINSPYESRIIHKIAYVSQESSLCPDLSVAENIFLGSWKKKMLGLVDWKTLINEADRLINQFGLNLDSTVLVKNLKPADRQLVEIIRALSIESNILLLDEPTSWLSEREKSFLFERIKSLKEMGVGIVFISHFLEEVLKISDRIHVLRDGRTVGTFENEGMTKDELIEYVIGEKTKNIQEEDIQEELKNNVIVLEVKDISKEKQVEDITFDVKEGEIVGFTGLFGSGKTELARIIFGLTKPDRGYVRVFGKNLKWQNVNYTKSLGLGFVTEDRRAEGIVPLLSVANNISLASLKKIASRVFSILNLYAEEKEAQKFIKVMDIRAASPKQKVATLSGGNQQKVIVARWLQADSKILILDEPTRGVDVRAKYEIYSLIREQARLGKSIIFFSSELAEILEIPHRFFILKKGKIVGEFKHGEIADEKELLSILSA